MKHARKLTALAVVFGLLLTLWAPAAVTAAPVATPAAESRKAADPLDAPLELLAALDNGDTLCAVYSLIADGLRRGEEHVEFGPQYILTEEEQTILRTVVDATFPESYGNNVGHSYCTVWEDCFWAWFYDWGVTAEQNAQMEQAVAAMTADLGGKSDFDKSRILYERLVNANSYNYGEHHQTAYGALIEGMSVCAGYGRAYQMLLQAVGIPCLYVTGTANNGYGVGGHAWNLVKLDGEWYYADVTWDDHDSLYFGLDYTYFNVTYAEISTDHFADAEVDTWLPRSTATADNYYVHEGLEVESLTLQRMTAMFRQHNPLTLRVGGDVDENTNAIIQLFYQNGDAIADALGKGGYAGAGASTSSNGTGTLVTLYLVLDHAHNYDYLIIEPTCTSYGTTSYACRNCGDRNSAWTDPLGHAAGDWTWDETHHANACTRCGETLEYGEHTYENGAACDVCGYAPTPAVVAGDADGNGKVNNRDLGLLQRYLNGAGIAIDEAAIDMDGNGKINNRDLGLLQKRLNQG